MTPANFSDFFLAMAGAGGAFIGLLFVAISIHPDLTFRRPTATGVPRQFLAEATLVTLGNGFMVSSVALIPGVNAGWVALGLGLWGVVAAGRLVELLTRSHRHSTTTPRLHLLRVASLSLVAVVVFATEAVLGVSLLQQSASEATWSGLALVIVGIDALGLARAWILLGDPRQGWSGWLNPLRDRASADAADEATRLLPNVRHRVPRRSAAIPRLPAPGRTASPRRTRMRSMVRARIRRDARLDRDAVLVAAAAFHTHLLGSNAAKIRMWGRGRELLRCAHGRLRACANRELTVGERVAHPSGSVASPRAPSGGR